MHPGNPFEKDMENMVKGILKFNVSSLIEKSDNRTKEKEREEKEKAEQEKAKYDKTENAVKFTEQKKNETRQFSKKSLACMYFHVTSLFYTYSR